MTADLSTITIPVAALSPVLSFVLALLERNKRRSLEARIVTLEGEVKDCQEGRLADAQRWAREVARGAQLGLTPPPRDGRLPPPEWDESTAVRNMRQEIEAEVRRYLEERTPPRQRLPSRPQ